MMSTHLPQQDQNGVAVPEHDHPPQPLWSLLLRIQDHDQSFQPTLEECMELIEFDADRLARGERMDKMKPEIDYHLAICSPYREQLNQWVEKLVKLSQGDHSQEDHYNQRN